MIAINRHPDKLEPEMPVVSGILTRYFSSAWIDPQNPDTQKLRVNAALIANCPQCEIEHEHGFTPGEPLEASSRICHRCGCEYEVAPFRPDDPRFGSHAVDPLKPVYVRRRTTNSFEYVGDLLPESKSA